MASSVYIARPDSVPLCLVVCVFLDENVVGFQSGEDPVALLDHEPLDEPLVGVRHLHGHGPDVQEVPGDGSEHGELCTLHIKAEVVDPWAAQGQDEGVEGEALDAVQLPALLPGHGGPKAQEVVPGNGVGTWK